MSCRAPACRGRGRRGCRRGSERWVWTLDKQAKEWVGQNLLNSPVVLVLLHERMAIEELEAGKRRSELRNVHVLTPELNRHIFR